MVLGKEHSNDHFCEPSCLELRRPECVMSNSVGEVEDTSTEVGKGLLGKVPDIVMLYLVLLGRPLLYPQLQGSA